MPRLAFIKLDSPTPEFPMGRNCVRLQALEELSSAYQIEIRLGEGSSRHARRRTKSDNSEQVRPKTRTT